MAIGTPTFVCNRHSPSFAPFLNTSGVPPTAGGRALRMPGEYEIIIDSDGVTCLQVTLSCPSLPSYCLSTTGIYPGALQPHQRRRAHLENALKGAET